MKAYLTRPKYVSTGTSPYNWSRVKLIHLINALDQSRSIVVYFLDCRFLSHPTREDFRSPHHPINSLVPGSAVRGECLAKICREDIFNEVTEKLDAKLSKKLWKRQQMPCIRIKEAYQNTRHVIDGIELSCRVGELKEKTAEKTNIPAEQQSKFMSCDT